MTDFEISMQRNHLGFIPREHNNQDEKHAGRHGEVDEVTSAYWNNSANVLLFEGTQHFESSLYSSASNANVQQGLIIAGAEQRLQLENNREKFPFKVGLRFFPTVAPINELLYGDAVVK